MVAREPRFAIEPHYVSMRIYFLATPAVSVCVCAYLFYVEGRVLPGDSPFNTKGGMRVLADSSSNNVCSLRLICIIHHSRVRKYYLMNN